MTSPSKDYPHSRDDFEIAIICASAMEANAVIALFDYHWNDKTHGLRPALGEDRNEYTLGRIGLHNVVVVVLTAMGKKEASSAITAMHPTFRNLQLTLIVGVCDVAPVNTDYSEIVLGDVVVSTYVIQYDLGRQYEDTFATKNTLKDNLGKPRQEVQRLLKKLELEHHHERLKERMRGYSKQLQSRNDVYTYPGTSFDHLYAPHYTHMHRQTCSICQQVEGAPASVCGKARSTTCTELGCDRSQLIPRRRLLESAEDKCHASIWFGRFASADQAIKSAAHRDRLRAQEQIIAFEMEGSGAWDHFPTIIIKSGCAYADGHKNKIWREHCAGNAAACAKALLHEWRRKDGIQEDGRSLSLSLRLRNTAHETTQVRLLPSRTVNPLFRGREAQLREIEKRFSATAPGKSTNSSKTVVLILQGIGGSGKSELCLHYLEMHESNYWAVFWIDGSNESSLKNGYNEISKRLALGSHDATTVRHNLATRDKKWLLVVDNADDPHLDLGPYLPSRGIGHVIVTTRNPELDTFSSGSIMHLEDLARDDARELLFKAARTPDETQASLAITADEIVEELNFHPLAILQAGSYIRKMRDFKGYLRHFHTQRRTVLQYYGAQARAQYGSVFATFEVSASRLQQDADQQQTQSAAADALELLHLFAFMDSRGPLERIFSDAREFIEACVASLPPVASTDGKLNGLEYLARKRPNLISSLAYVSTNLEGQYRWRKACDQLYQCSLLSFEEDENGDELLIFHPLVLAWALARQSKEDFRKSWLSVAATIAFSGHEIRDYGPILDRLGPHAHTCSNQIMNDWWKAKSSLLYLPVLYALARMLLLRRDDAVNSKLCECLATVLEIVGKRKSVSTPELTTAIEYLLGRHAAHVGNIDESVRLLEHVVEVQGTTLAKADPVRLESQSSLAVSYRMIGQHQKALTLLEHVVEVHSKTLPETHPYRLTSQFELARAYNSNGQTQNAIALLEHVVTVQKTRLTEAHPDRLACQHVLAWTYRWNGQIQDAITLLEHVVKVQKKTLTETHPDRLESQYELAGAYNSNGQIQDAITLLEYVVKVQKKTLAEAHPSRLSSQHTLAIAYHSNGQVQKAITLLENVVDMWRTQATTHPNRLVSQYELARAYQSNGQIQKAITLHEYVVEVCRKTLTETHPNRLAAQYELARAYRSNMQAQQAVSLLEHVVKIEDKILVAAHPGRLSSQEELARAYDLDGQSQKAVTLLEHVLTVWETMVVETHPRLVAAQLDLIKAYQSNGQIQQAVMLLIKVSKARGKA